MNIIIKMQSTSTVLPFVDGNPYWNADVIPESTLSLLRAAYEAGHYEIILDPEPIQELPVPNWDGFNLAFSTLPSLLQAEITANQNHPSIVGKKDLAYSMINDHGTDAFALIFPLFCQAGAVDSETRLEWAELAESFNMPSDFISVIRG